MVPAIDGAVRLGPDVRGHIYVKTGGEWVLSRNKVRLPEGWYATDLDTKRPAGIRETTLPTEGGAAGD